MALKRSGFPSQDALADAVGVSKQVLNQIKKRKTPGLKRWPDIADKLRVPLEWLRDGVGDSPVWTDIPTPPAPIPADIGSAILAEMQAIRAELSALNARLTVPAGAMRKVVSKVPGQSHAEQRRRDMEALVLEHGTPEEKADAVASGIIRSPVEDGVTHGAV